MRTTKMLAFTLMAVIFSLSANAKNKKERTDWSKVDFVKEYKMKIKLPGAAKKSLKSNPTFISDYSINNALRMKGSESNAKGTVHSEVFFGGISQDKFQAMVEELYQHFQNELSRSGIILSDGEALLQNDYTLKQKENDKNLIGKNGTEPDHQEAALMDGSIPGYGVLFVKEGLTFRPVNKNSYVAGKKIYGNFYQKLSTQENVNLLSIGYFITFAGFEGSRGYSSARLETSAALSVQPYIMLVNPKGAFAFLTMDRGPIWGNNDWSLGLKETELNKLEYFGLATSAKYAIQANPDKYIAELKAIIMNYQVALVKAIKENL